MGLISITTPNDGENADAADLTNPLNTIVSEINGNLDANNLAASAVTTAKINNEAVTGAKIADSTVTSEKLNATVAFSAYASGAINAIDGSTVCTFDAESYDYGNNFNTTTHRFVAPYNGIYAFYASINFDSGNESVRVDFRKNGSIASLGHHIDAAGVAGVDGNVAAHSAQIKLAATDYVEVWIFTDDGVNTTAGETNAHFSGHLVGRVA